MDAFKVNVRHLTTVCAFDFHYGLFYLFELYAGILYHSVHNAMEVPFFLKIQVIKIDSPAASKIFGLLDIWFLYILVIEKPALLYRFEMYPCV